MSQGPKSDPVNFRFYCNVSPRLSIL